jgi:hypothetical protein
MHSQRSGWNNLLTKLGLTRTKRKARSKPNQFRRRLRIESLEGRQLLAVFTVNIDVDEDDGVQDGEISIRDAIIAASAGDTINFDESLDGATITLDRVNLGQIEFGKSLTIDASMLSNGITIDANDPSSTFGDGIRIFNITDPTSGSAPPLVTMKNRTLTGADVPDNGGAILANEVRLVLENCTIESNSALTGGGITVWANNFTGNDLNYLTLRNTRIQNNTAFTTGSGGNGGGIYVQAYHAQISILQSSSISGNTAQSRGGGMYFITTGDCEIDIADTVISGNTSQGDAGGLYAAANDTSLTIVHTTISGNQSLANNGGGLAIAASGGAVLRIEDSTFFSNESAVNGGAVWASVYGASSFTVDRAMASGNTSGTNGGGLHVELGNASALSVADSEISGNTASTGDGGGMFARALSPYYNPFPQPRAITISRSLISGNTALNRGGGIYTKNFAGTESRIEESRITGNHVPESLNYYTGSDRNGGGIYAFVSGDLQGTNTPRFTITGSTVDNNDTYQNGGGIFVCAKFDGLFNANNSTLSGNQTTGSTSAGGGIFIARTDFEDHSLDAYLRHLTITQNVSPTGGGVRIAELEDVRVRISNTIISENFDEVDGDPNNLVGPIVINESFNNLVGSGSTVLDHTNLGGGAVNLATVAASNDWILSDEPKLEPLDWYGGPTLTHRLQHDSPAIDEGDDDYAVDPLTDEPLEWDQRGEKFPRIMDVPGTGGDDGTVDIGAYEIGLAKMIDVRLNGVMVDVSGTPAWTAGPISYAELVPLGLQFAPIYRDGVNSIQIVFSEAVETLTETDLKLVGTGERHANVTAVIDNIDFDDETNTWTFDILGGDKYRIDMMSSDVLDMFGRALDGHWLNADGPIDANNMVPVHTPDYLGDDPLGRTLVSGNDMPGSPFQFMFGLLPGDYNQDGVVDGGDYTIWQLDESEVDGNGDGEKDNADYDIWSAHFNEGLLLRRRTGDYNDNDYVSMDDYMIWRTTYGQTQTGDEPLAADGNNNEAVDAADFTLWRYWEDTMGAWYLSPTGVGSLLPIVDFGNAPKVANVTISGSNSLHAAYSFDAHDGSGEQLMTVPVGGANTIAITFSEDVNVVAGNLRLVGLRTFNVPTVAEFSYDIGTMTATWRFDDLVANDHYIISLSDAVTDIEGNRLDGEWVNPVSTTTTNSLVSEFPSGDGNAGGHFNFVMTLIAIDFSNDNYADNDDYSIWNMNEGQILFDAIFSDGDANGDGDVDGG